MNGAEYAALDDIHIPPDAKLLYLMCLRRWMNYTDGTVFCSYTKMIDSLAYEPVARSKDRAVRFTIGQVRNLTKRLEEANLIRKIEKGNVKTGQCAKWYCCLADNDEKRKAALIRQNQEQQYSARQEQQEQDQVYQGLEGEQQQYSAKQQQHISDLPHNKYICAREFEFCEQVRMVARSRRLADDDMLPGVFQQFLDSPKHRDKYQPHEVWLKDWGYWCATSNVYNQQWSNKQNAKTNNTNTARGGDSVIEQLTEQARAFK